MSPVIRHYGRHVAKQWLGTVIVFLLSHAVFAAGQLPQWVTAPPADDKDYLYGVGEGDDRESAKHSALAAIAGTLMTQVRSSTAISQTLSKGEFVETLQAHVDTQVGDTELSHYQLLEAQKVNKRWWVLVQLPRDILVKANLTRLTEADKSLTNAVNRIKAQSAFEQFLNYRPVSGQLKEAQAALALLRAADPDFSGEDYARRYLEYENYLGSIFRSFEIKVDSDGVAKGFSQKLVNLLSREQVRVSLGKVGSGHASIEIRSEIENFSFGEDFESKVTLRLTTMTGKGVPLATVTRTEVGASMTDGKIASKQALNIMARKMEQQQVFRYLGLTVAQ